jgi:hypothetical protein
MDQEMDWEEYEKILMQRPGFKEALEETLFEYETARTKIKSRIMGLKVDTKKRKLIDISLDVVQASMKLIDQFPDKLIISSSM